MFWRRFGLQQSLNPVSRKDVRRNSPMLHPHVLEKTLIQIVGA